MFYLSPYEKEKIKKEIIKWTCIIIACIVAFVAFKIFRLNKKIESLQEEKRASVQIEASDGSKVTSVNAAIESEKIKLKEDLSELGETVMFTETFSGKDLLNMGSDFETEWGGKIKIDNKVKIKYEYRVNPKYFNISDLGDATYIVIPSKSFVCNVTIPENILVEENLSFMAHTEQFFKRVFTGENIRANAINEANEAIKLEAEKSGEASLKDTEVQAKLKDAAVKYYSEFFKAYNLDVYLQIGD